MAATQIKLKQLIQDGAASTGEFIRWNGTNWVASALIPATISGGTTGFLPKLSGSTTLVNSKVFENSNTVSVGTDTGIDIYTRFYIYGGASGANLDIRGETGSVKDIATCEVQGADYSTNFRSAWIRYLGSTVTGTTYGMSNHDLAELAFADPANALIRSITDIPIQLFVNSVQSGQITSSSIDVRTGKDLRIYDSDNTQYIAFKAPATASLTTSYTLTLPVDDGNPGEILSTNGTGTLSWAANGSNASSGISGAVQFSGGSGTFSSDATNFFFDDSASVNQLKLNGASGYNLLIAGQNGAIDATAGSSVTGFWNVLRSATNATGSLNILVDNANTSSSTSHAKIRLSTSTGGGDPFVQLNTAEVGYVMGIDNSASDILVIGLGTDPSTMSTTNITLSGSSMGVMQGTPTAKLHLGAGAVGASSAPIKLTSGTAMTTPEDGAVEYHSSHLWFTIGSTRYQLDQQSGGSSLTVGTTAITSGTTTRVLYDNAGVLGEYVISGTGNVAMTTSPTFTTPALGTPSAAVLTNATGLPLNALVAAGNTNTLDNLNFTQTWNWSTLSTGTGFAVNANGLTTGTFLTINTNNSSLNSTNGMLFVNNNGTSVSGTVAKFQSNGNISGSGLIVKANGTVGIGLTSSTAMLHLGGTPSLANGSTSGMFFRADASAVTDTTGTGTVTHTAISAFNAPTIFASSTVTYTNSSTLYIAGAPTASTNVTITNPYAFWVETGAIKLGSSNTGVAILTSGLLSTKTNPSGAFVGDTDTQTLTNKRITSRVTTASDATSITPNTDSADMTYQANTQALGTLTINADAGTPTNGQLWRLKIKSTNVQTFSWNSVFVGGSGSAAVTLPTTTTGGSKIDYIGFMYDSVSSKWDVVSVATGY